MTKRLNMVDVVNVGGYTVAIERLKNTPSGNPRYKAIIIFNNGYNAVYTFTGHYLSVADEAKWIVDYHNRTQS